MHHGRVLRIDRAEVSDNGRYKCSAGNSLGVAAGEVTLSLRTPPTIILPLADRLVATESTFTLECPLSTTDAHSTVEWFKDAKPIVPLLMPSHQRKRFNVDQNILTVNSTTTTDSGVYQCIISNEVGLASSSAYVLVRDSPPVFPRQSMPRKLFAVNGSSVSIPCFYYASPKGHSRWADAGGAKLPHKGRVRDHHGVLIIENVLHDDAGYFFCSAHNRLGKAHAQMELADASGGYLVELRTKEDRQWRPAPREVVAETESQSITLDSLTPNTLYQFRVRTVDSATMGDPSAPTPWIRTPPAPPSEAVEGLRWRALDNTTILVEWDPVETVHNSGEHLRYRLSWSLEDNNDAKSESEGKRKFHSYHIETKTPQAIVRMNATDECRMLVFSVRPINDQGIGLTSTDTVAFINTKGEPRQVSFTNATVLNSTHASFSWEWDKLSCSTEGSDPIVVAVSADFAKWDLGGLSADSKYSCILRPFDVEEDDVGYTTVIEWTAINIPDTNFTDETSGYKIFVYVSETASEAVVLTMPINRLSNPERPSARLDGLRLMYLYTIQVAGYNSGGLGPLSSPRIIRLGPQYSLDEPSSARSLRFSEDPKKE
ncbi:immunoglobulin domain protein [Necator americanus]|uniref:Immunoglobulin domain protein n=1 Tax=Necator americanus TaxID=51031 RepID=W2T4J1_NECAM|nr:immunoglobulin domain protein [Necator americanus]ETN76788.1 immunoglobulin domain protein [Necator americanus]